MLEKFLVQEIFPWAFHCLFSSPELLLLHRSIRNPKRKHKKVLTNDNKKKRSRKKRKISKERKKNKKNEKGQDLPLLRASLLLHHPLLKKNLSPRRRRNGLHRVAGLRLQVQILRQAHTTKKRK